MLYAAYYSKGRFHIVIVVSKTSHISENITFKTIKYQTYELFEQTA